MVHRLSRLQRANLINIHSIICGYLFKMTLDLHMLIFCTFIVT